MSPHFAGEPLEPPQGPLQVPSPHFRTQCSNSPNEGIQTQTLGV